MNRPNVRLGGVLGEALEANRSGRLSHFITSEASPAVALFSPEHRGANREGDWYGEHAGKWLSAAARAASRGDAELAARVRRVAGYLASVQEADGYLGTYAPERRFTAPVPPPQRTWDGAPGQRTWDIWTHAYLVLGFLDVHERFPDERYLAAARRIGDLCLKRLDEGVDFTWLGNHFGMSATVMIDAAVALNQATREERYLDLARRIAAQADARPELQLLTRALAGVDASEIGTGKAYQLCWNMVGLAKLARATREASYREAAERVWNAIAAHHLTPGGGPWGGVGLRSREVFNPPGVFSPEGYVETCSTLAWMQLNHQLSQLTGDAKYAEEIERSAYNALLGAQAPGGEDWCYYSFPNGRRVFTTYWRCCKSSGAVAIEELPEMAFGLRDGAIEVNVYAPGEADFELPGALRVRLVLETRYPFDGKLRLRVDPERAARFALRLRIPAWATGATVHIDAPQPATAGTYTVLDREWRGGDAVTIVFPMRPMLRRALHRNVQESVAPDGSPIHQEVLRQEFVTVTRGPLAYATDLIDGFKPGESVRIPAETRALLEELPPPPGFSGPAVRMNLGYREPLVFLPYYEAGGRSDGTWRLSWLAVAPASAELLPPASPPPGTR